VPPPVSRPGGRFRRLRLAGYVVLLVLVAGGVYAFRHLGTFMAPEDPLQNADVIFVLAGTVAERPLEAADLYKAGYAPKILVTRDLPEKAMLIAAERGAPVPMTSELNRRMLLALGVPEAALIVPDRVHDNTAQEAQTFHRLALQYGWRKVIVVSSKYHLRRVSLALHRELGDTPVQIILHGTKYDDAAPDRWWTRRYDIRWLLSELPKYAAYLGGLGG
jgi:uncharacterized SAM-binding protein YcdF (DUF218 family)